MTNFLLNRGPLKVIANDIHGTDFLSAVMTTEVTTSLSSESTCQSVLIWLASPSLWHTSSCPSE